MLRQVCFHAAERSLCVQHHDKTSQRALEDALKNMFL